LRQLATLSALVIILSALIFAQFPASGGASQTPLVIADGVAARALAISPVAPNTAVYLTNATVPNRIQVLSAPSSTPIAANRLANFAGTGAVGSLGDGGAALSAQFSLSSDSLVERSGVAVASDGTIYVADTQNSTIRAIASPASTEPDVVRSIAGKWAPAQNVTLTEPMGLALDRAGDLFVADHAGGTVDKIAAGNGPLEILAHVISPASIAVTPDGSKVFVASPETGAVFAINVQTRAIDVVPGFAPANASTSSSGTNASSSAATPSSGPCASVSNTAVLSGAASSSQAICPAGIAVDGASNLFVADAISGRVLRVDAQFGATTVSASGLHTPGAIAFDASGDLYIADQAANRVVAMLQIGAIASGITIAPSSATYINQPLGGNTPGQLFTLTNSSSSVISALNVAVAGANLSDFPIQGKSCLTTLAANSSCTINVAFVPQATGARNATLTATDSVSTDSASASLSGTGDDFQLSIPTSQPTQVSVQAGGTATFTAQVVPDSNFGKNGEKVNFVCPSNLPANTTCSLNPSSVSVKPGTPVSFQIGFVTTNLLGTTGSFPFSALPVSPGSFTQGPRGGGPSGLAPSTAPARQIRNGVRFFPARIADHIAGPILGVAYLLGLRVAMLIFVMNFGPFGRRRRPLISMLGFAGLSVAALAGCHHSKGPSLATPTGTTLMTIQGNAVDANGNSLNASRTVSISLVVTSD
jgi:sugar lactone lactonase YvrE